MNPSTLTAKEVLRMCSPETDLERRLFDLVSELQDDLDSANNELDEHESQMLYCTDCADVSISIISAIEKIESGSIDDALTILRAL